MWRRILLFSYCAPVLRRWISFFFFWLISASICYVLIIRFTIDDVTFKKCLHTNRKLNLLFKFNVNEIFGLVAGVNSLFQAPPRSNTKNAGVNLKNKKKKKTKFRLFRLPIEKCHHGSINRDPAVSFDCLLKWFYKKKFASFKFISYDAVG